jgi:hypothetical protein
VTIPVADYVSVQAKEEPTDEQWREVLEINGFTSEQIDTILKGE